MGILTSLASQRAAVVSGNRGADGGNGDDGSCVGLPHVGSACLAHARAGGRAPPAALGNSLRVRIVPIATGNAQHSLEIRWAG